VWDVGRGDDSEDPAGVFSGQEVDQADLPGAAGIFPALGIGFGSGIVGAILPALIGAVILLLVLKLIRRAS
jgi:uncharacterized membrane protein YhiD involved in acid resistance